MVNAESVANASHRTRVEKSLKEKAIFNHQKFYKYFIYQSKQKWINLIRYYYLSQIFNFMNQMTKYVVADFEN